MIRSRAKLGLSSVVVMEAARQEAGGGDEKICRRNDGKIYCKNVNGDNKLQYCDKHYKDFTDFYTENPSLLISSNKIRFLPKEKMEEIEFLMKNKLPLPDEHLCRHNNGTWRCKNLRMAHSVPKTKYCERHYNYYKNLRKKKTSRDGDGASGIKTRDPNFSKMRNKVMEEHDRSLDVTGIQPAANSSTKNPSSMTSKKRKYLKKNKEEMEMKLLPDEHFCSHTSGIYRCGNFSMSHGAAAEDPSVPKSRFCEKHYNYYSNYYNNLKKKKKLFKNTSRDGEGAGTGIGPIEPRDSNCSKSRKKIMEEHDRSLDVAGIQPAASGDFSDRIGRTMENVERAEKSGEPESLTGNMETVVESESLEHHKSKCFELSVEFEKRKVECTKLQGKLAEVEEIRKTAAADETQRTHADAFECWRKMFSDLAESMESRILDLENIVLRMDNKLSTMEGYVESRISKLESLVLRSGKESSTLRCVQLHSSEKIDCEAQGSQNDVIQRGEKQRDENDRKDSNVYECKTKEKVLNVYDPGSLRVLSEGENVEEWKGWGCSEERPSQHGSSSQDHLEMYTEPFVHLVSDEDSVEILGESEDSDSECSLGALMDMLAMKYRNTNEDKEIKWKFEADMVSSFEEEPELCMKAVCSLYRQQICEDKGLLHNSDALRNWVAPDKQVAGFSVIVR
ncbi:uncharacterized protein LOC113330222 isoform X2 [Papaver somniferum]|uniref:uncharacterized protein LOC113330222 isoform X2 n=1 Tax=Papaver somniferum TaxID=3469 RepID=UPI000E6F4CEB|nr:uncharacterized protein LOC113330222 isoform X2 [Papaver somniferum]